MDKGGAAAAASNDGDFGNKVYLIFKFSQCSFRKHLAQTGLEAAGYRATGCSSDWEAVRLGQNDARNRNRKRSGTDALETPILEAESRRPSPWCRGAC